MQGTLAVAMTALFWKVQHWEGGSRIVALTDIIYLEIQGKHLFYTCFNKIVGYVIILPYTLFINVCKVINYYKQNWFFKQFNTILTLYRYALRETMMTPIGRTNNQAEERYNRSHIRTRNTIERAFGVLKQRFR